MAAGASMNSRRSYLDAINAGRQRRASSALEQISQSLEELGDRIGAQTRHPDPVERRQRHPRDDHDPRGFRGHEAYRAYEAYEDERYERHMPGRREPARHDDVPAGLTNVAGELNSLRQELRHQMSAGLAREFSALRADIERAMSSPRPSAEAAELGAEFDRLSAIIHEFANRGDDRHINLLRLEMEEVKAELGKLAREETLRSVDSRWGEIETRFREASSGNVDNPAFQALLDRLEQISGAVDGLPNSVAMRSVEDRLKTLAAAVDQFAHQQDRIGPEALDAIEQRLDEISRAVAASSAATPAPLFDPEPFERIEARLAMLARQIADAAGAAPARDLRDQMAALTERVNALATHADVPAAMLDRLDAQIAAIARRLDEAPATSDVSDIMRDLDQRFGQLSDLMEKRHEDALAQGNSLFRDLEQRLRDVDAHVGQAGGAASHPDLLREMDARFDALTERLESRPAKSDPAIRNLEERLEGISAQLETSSRHAGGIDPELIRSLESQVSALSERMATPGAASESFTDVGPRLEELERAIARNREDVMEAARRAAEQIAGTLATGAPERESVTALAEELKSLEQLSRRSDERNSRTFEAIHDTLLKIVDRLGSLETTTAAATGRLAQEQAASLPQGFVNSPSIDPVLGEFPLADAQAERQEPAKPSARPRGRARTPALAAAQAAAEAAQSEPVGGEEEPSPGRSSLFGGLTRAISGRVGRSKQPAEAKAEASVDEPAPAAELREASPDPVLDMPLEPELANQPLEPGSGAPDLHAIMRRVRDERATSASVSDPDAAKSDFIAAARRAAQAAAAEAEIMKRKPLAKGNGGGSKLAGLLSGRKRTLMLGVAVILAGILALQFGRSFVGGNAEADLGAAPAALVAAAKPAEDEAPVAAETEQAAAPDAAMDQVEAEPQPDVRSAELLPTGDGEVQEPVEAAEKPVETAAAGTPDTSWLEEEPAGPEAAALQPDAPAAEPAPAEASASEVAAPEKLAPAGIRITDIPEEIGPEALRLAAQEGDPKALFEIGNRYAEGRGVEQDMAVAASWYEAAADQGLAPAQYRTGNMYEKGIGVERDVAKAKTWYQLAATQGNASAMHNLAVLFAMGAGGTPDNESAARWFLEAAELGVRDSQYNLGILAAKGIGMKQDLVEAYKWFDLVAAAGDKDAAAKRDEIAEALGPEQLEKARATAELWQARPIDEDANIVRIPDDWTEGETTTAQIDMDQVIRNLQTILNQRGYDAGPADGVMGERTKSAIASFQADNGMEATGKIDDELVRALLDRG